MDWPRCPVIAAASCGLASPGDALIGLLKLSALLPASLQACLAGLLCTPAAAMCKCACGRRPGWKFSAARRCRCPRRCSRRRAPPRASSRLGRGQSRRRSSSSSRRVGRRLRRRQQQSRPWQQPLWQQRQRQQPQQSQSQSQWHPRLPGLPKALLCRSSRRCSGLGSRSSRGVVTFLTGGDAVAQQCRSPRPGACVYVRALPPGSQIL